MYLWHEAQGVWLETDKEMEELGSLPITLSAFSQTVKDSSWAQNFQRILLKACHFHTQITELKREKIAP